MLGKGVNGHSRTATGEELMNYAVSQLGVGLQGSSRSRLCTRKAVWMFSMSITHLQNEGKNGRLYWPLLKRSKCQQLNQAEVKRRSSRTLFHHYTWKQSLSLSKSTFQSTDRHYSSSKDRVPSWWQWQPEDLLVHKNWIKMTIIIFWYASFYPSDVIYDLPFWNTEMHNQVRDKR